MAMQVAVEGEDISPEEFQFAGWQSAFTKRKSSQKCLPAESEQPANTPSGSSNGGSRTPASVKKRLVAASRMPRLPKEHFRVIVRPRGGLNVKNASQVKVAQARVNAAGLPFANTAEDIICPNTMQNILVVSTPSEHNAKTCAGIEAISIGSAIYEVSSCLAAPDNTCKGIIRNIDLELDHEQLRSLIIQPRNPKALEARRIKNSTTVVILFDGLKVPNHVMCGLSMLRCTLYRRQTEVCYACGRLGHRADVCPTPENVVCRGCGVNSPSDQHVCSPKCALCGGPHPTADKSCKQRYQVPYIVRQRRKERRDYNQDFPPMGTLSGPAIPPRAWSGSRVPGITRVPSRGRSRVRLPRATSGGRSRSGGHSHSRGSAVRIRKPVAQETGWADRVKGSPTKVTGATPPGQHNTRLVQLEKENAALKGAIEQLRSEMAELRSARKCKASPSPQAPKPAREETPMEVPVEAPSEARTAKKRALTKPVCDEGLEEFQTEMRVMLKSLSEACPFNAKVDVLDGKFNALEARGLWRRGEGRWSFVLLRTMSLLRPETQHLLSWRLILKQLESGSGIAGVFSARGLSSNSSLDLIRRSHTKPLKEFTITDWDQFRKSREERALIQDSSIDLERWATQLKGDVISATKTVQTDLEIDRMDNRLANLLEAKKALLDRWKGQRLNRRLRKKIAELNRTIEDHCQSLTRQQWDEVCNSVDGEMRVGGKWNLLKHLLNESNSNSNQNRVISRVLHEARQSETEDALLDVLTNKYLPIGTSSPADYPEVLQNLNGRSAPGPDGISNRALRNLEDGSIEFLTDEINRIWEQGSVPESWKTATVVLIPKPGRPPGLANLRPISLTSCVGKVAEHVIHNRISRHIEGKNLFTYNMIGFRPSLSTQDAMKLLKHQIFNRKTRDVRAILGLDLEKAFDNITHAHILDSISELGLGDTFHKFVSSFLRSRKATLKIGDLRSDPVELGPKGTPQGAVISPLLFNIAMCKLSKQLSTVEGINHTLYADDITIWCVGGSEGEVETALQEALDQTEHCLTNTGLKCSSSKSELLLYRPVRGGPKPKGWMPLSEVDITIHTSTGNPIPRVDVLRVLGMLVESNGSNSRTINKITTKTENMIRLINRVSNRRGGLREDNLLRLFHAFLMSHITYVAAMHCWHGHEKKKLDTLIRKSIKRVLGIPMQASTERLMQLGAHNTLEEIIEAQETAQIARLSFSPAGRKILAILGLNPTLVAERRHQLSDAQRASIQTSPFPRNLHPQHNVGRRRARAVALLRQLDSLTNLNDTANSRARALTLRAGKDADLQGGYVEFKDILFTFNEVTTHYRMGRRTFPPPHVYLPGLRVGQQLGSHALAVPLVTEPNQVTEEEWSSAITSSELLPQLRAVQRAHDAAVRLGLPVPTWERPAVLP
ncbi:hypothetical protein ISCGN_023386 [Ixodes scapularis]